MQKPDPGAPWLPFAWDRAKPGCHAIQALYSGTASPDQQQLALKTIIEGISGAYDEHFHPDHARWTDYALGKAHVGQQIVKILKLNFTRIKEAKA